MTLIVLISALAGFVIGGAVYIIWTLVENSGTGSIPPADQPPAEHAENPAQGPES